MNNKSFYLKQYKITNKEQYIKLNRGGVFTTLNFSNKLRNIIDKEIYMYEQVTHFFNISSKK